MTMGDCRRSFSTAHRPHPSCNSYCCRRRGADLDPADADGDPALRACGKAFAGAQHLRSIVYLSTVGVYGDRGGDWVDEETPPGPESARGRERLAAERAWQDFGARRGIACRHLAPRRHLRAGRNALTQVARGGTRRIVKPGQIFNRIHVADIAQAIDAARSRDTASGIFNRR